MGLRREHEFKPLSDADRTGITEYLARLKMLAVYAGGFVGPFTGMLVVPVLPEVATTFGISTDVASFALVAYIAPFATLMLFSGAISVRLGKTRTVRIGYAAYVVAAFLCFLAPTWPTFLLSLVMAGLSNSFTTPILLSILKDSAPPASLGKRIGWFASMQALGQICAPFISGFLATFDWKLSYLFVSLFAALLLILGLPRPKHHAASPTGRTRLTQVLGRATPIMLMYFVLGIGSIGLQYLVSVHAYDAWGASTVERGLVIMVGGVAVLVLSGVAGTLLDRLGARAMLLSGSCLIVAGLFALPFAVTFMPTTIAWCLVIVGGQVCNITLNRQVLTMPGSQTLISITQSLRFFGTAASPIVVLPVFMMSAHAGFWMCAGLTIAGVVVALVNLGSARGQAGKPSETA